MWWKRTLETLRESPNLRTDAGLLALLNIDADEIATEISHQSFQVALDLGDASVIDPTMRSSDIARYQAVHEKFVKQIFDAGLQDVWFDPRLK